MKSGNTPTATPATLPPTTLPPTTLPPTTLPPATPAQSSTAGNTPPHMTPPRVGTESAGTPRHDAVRVHATAASTPVPEAPQRADATLDTTAPPAGHPAHPGGTADAAPTHPTTEPTTLSGPGNTAPPVATPPAPQPAATSASPSTAATAPLLHAHQPIVAAVARLRSRNGTHELTVELHPQELGQVNVRAIVRDHQLSLLVSCAEPTAHDAIQAALPTLNSELRDAGFAGVDLSLGQQAKHDHHDRPAGHPAGTGTGTAEPDRDRERPARRSLPRSVRGVDRWL